MSIKDICELGSLLSSDDWKEIDLRRKLSEVENSIHEHERRLNLEDENKNNIKARENSLCVCSSRLLHDLDFLSVSIDELFTECLNNSEYCPLSQRLCRFKRGKNDILEEMTETLSQIETLQISIDAVHAMKNRYCMEDIMRIEAVISFIDEEIQMKGCIIESLTSQLQFTKIRIRALSLGKESLANAKKRALGVKQLFELMNSSAAVEMGNLKKNIELEHLRLDKNFDVLCMEHEDICSQVLRKLCSLTKMKTQLEFALMCVEGLKMTIEENDSIAAKDFDEFCRVDCSLRTIRCTLFEKKDIHAKLQEYDHFLSSDIASTLCEIACCQSSSSCLKYRLSDLELKLFCQSHLNNSLISTIEDIRKLNVANSSNPYLCQLLTSIEEVSMRKEDKIQELLNFEKKRNENSINVDFLEKIRENLLCHHASSSSVFRNSLPSLNVMQINKNNCTTKKQLLQNRIVIVLEECENKRKKILEMRFRIGVLNSKRQILISQTEQLRMHRSNLAMKKEKGMVSQLQRRIEDLKKQDSLSHQRKLEELRTLLNRLDFEFQQKFLKTEKYLRDSEVRMMEYIDDVSTASTMLPSEILSSPYQRNSGFKRPRL